MPYIKEEERNTINKELDLIAIDSPGQLNYAITYMILRYINKKWIERTPGIVKYQDINDVIGALEGAKLEFYRRYVSTFEDKKKVENGDVY